MPPIVLLLAALAALLLPPGAGLGVVAVVAFVAARPAPGARAGVRVLPGLLLLGSAPLVPAWRPPPSAPPSGLAALRVCGTLRLPPAGMPALLTPAGPLPLETAPDLRLPDAGTPVELLLRLGADGGAQVVALRVLGPTRGAWLDRWATRAAARVRRLVSRDNAGLLAALFLGQRQDLAFAVRSDCRATGTAHILAISGMHVAIVAAALSSLSACGSWRRPALLLAGFVALAGGAAPLARSFAGWLLHVAGLRLARPGDGLLRLLGVALLLECWRPGLLRGLSAQLSFLAVGGLVAGARLAPGRAAAILAPAGAFLATAPLCAETFGVVQPAGILVTPLVTPLLAVVLLASLLAVLPGALFAALDPLLAPVLQLALDALRALLAFAARACPAPLEPPPPPLPGLLLSLLAIAALLVLGRGRRARAWEAAG